MLHQSFPPVCTFCCGFPQLCFRGTRLVITARSTERPKVTFCAVCSSEPVGDKPFLSLSFSAPPQAPYRRFSEGGRIRNFIRKGAPGDTRSAQKRAEYPLCFLYYNIITHFFRTVKTRETRDYNVTGRFLCQNEPRNGTLGAFFDRKGTLIRTRSKYRW